MSGQRTPLNIRSRTRSTRGWRGLNIEPVRAFAEALRRHRPGDVTIDKAAGAEHGSLVLYVSEGTGLSTASAEAASKGAEHDHRFVEVEVPVEPLDTMLEEAGFAEGEIHFLKVDVEGFEREVLLGANLSRWKPWIVVVEATEPLGTTQSHGDWEPLVLSAGYQMCLFDGLNRFYASDDHPELVERLSYPACVFDQPFQRAEASLAVERSRGEWAVRIQQLTSERDSMARRLDETQLFAEKFVASEARLHDLDEHLRSVFRVMLETERNNLQLRAQIAFLEQSWRVAEGQRDAYHQRLIEANTHIEAIHRTVSWRITRPVRGVRRLLPREAAQEHDDVETLSNRSANGQAGHAVAGRVTSGTPRGQFQAEAEALVNAFALRVAQVVALLQGQPVPASVEDGIPNLNELEDAFRTSTETPSSLAWLALTLADGRYPTEAELSRAVSRFRLDGPVQLISEVRRRFDVALSERRAPTGGLDIRQGLTVVDISHTAAHDLHTGIQRVVREVCTQWFTSDTVIPVHWSRPGSSIRALADSERRRMIDWRSHLHTQGSTLVVREPDEASGDTLLPWRCRLVLPELVADPPRCDVYRALTVSGVITGLSALAYDLIPVTAAETVTEGMSGLFASYLSTVKYADRLSAISAATALEYQGFVSALADQGIRGPYVVAHPLPADEPVIDPADVERLSDDLGLLGTPLVLVVGSHEPRKNHLVVLEAAEHLWRQGNWFQLLFIGGSGWRSEPFEEEVERLTQAGRPVRVMKRVTEAQLWAGYSLARFTVFPSIVEGFGLPIAESLRCGTPVITSNFGSMAEIGSHGGAVLVSPRDPLAIKDAMHELLTDDFRLSELTREAQARSWRTWDSYAREVWEHLVPEDGRERA